MFEQTTTAQLRESLLTQQARQRAEEVAENARGVAFHAEQINRIQTELNARAVASLRANILAKSRAVRDGLCDVD